VLNAFQRVRQHMPEATLDLVGEHPPVNQPGVKGHGFLARQDLAAQAQLDALFARATAFVLPSLFDPSPIAYLEAASSGLPVVATTCGGAGELLGDASICVDPHDREGLVQAMLRVARPQVAQAMGQQAALRAGDASWKSVAKRITDRLMGMTG